MTPFLERLIELLAQWWARIVPWYVLGDDLVGLVRRLGVFHRDLHHGFNWKWPVIEEAMAAIAALDSTVLREQSLTTLDGVQVTLRCVLTYRVVDARQWILAVNDPESVLNDAGCLAVSELVPELSSFEVLQGEEFLTKLTRRVRARAKRWGIAVEAVGMSDRSAAPTYRIMGIK
jgi:regulator of protease activity HflC (stomatin/prohibitin superfamily)